MTTKLKSSLCGCSGRVCYGCINLLAPVFAVYLYSGKSRGFQSRYTSLSAQTKEKHAFASVLKQLQLFNHMFHANASTCCHTFNLSNTLKDVELKTLCMLVSTTVACLNISGHRLYKPFHSTGQSKLTTGYGTAFFLCVCKE